jgi:vitamin B12 transporter
MKKRIFVVAALISGSHLIAQQDSTVRSLDEVVITATRTPIKQSQTGKVVTVVDQEMLQRNVGKTLTEILNYQAGIFINGANSNLGNFQSLYFRGAGSGNALILIDGIPVMDPSEVTNSFDLNSINPSQIERIEILKGAQSTLWGSDAVAGVVNIITKKGGKNKFDPNILLSYGSYNTFRGNAGVSGSIKAFSYNVNYSHINTKGFSAAYDSTGSKEFDDDSYKQNTFQAALAYHFTPRLSLKGFANMGKYTTDVDAGAFKDDKDFVNENKNGLYSIDLNYQAPKFGLRFINSLQRSEREISDDSTDIGASTTFAYGFYNAHTVVSEIIANFKFSSRASLVAGTQGVFQNTDQGYKSISIFGPYETAIGDSAKSNNKSFYASFLLTDINGFNNELGFRYNHHSIYGSNATYTFNPSYNIDANTRVFVNISSGFKAPSLYQLYSEYGRKDLKPEKSNNYEVGVQAFTNEKKNSFRVVAFKRDIKDLIIYFTDASFNSYYINRDKQNDYGFEIESNIAVGKIGNWVNNITYVDGEGKNDGIKVKNLFRRPNFSLNSVLTVQPVTGLTIAPSFRFVGTRLKGTYDAGPEEMPQYYTLDLYTSYEFAKKVRAFVDLRNITDQRYFDVVGYNSRRFNLMFGVSASF